jgi:hypothetical protein
MFWSGYGGPLRRLAESIRADPDRFEDWVVYAKRPFAGAKQVLDYLGVTQRASTYGFARYETITPFRDLNRNAERRCRV